MRIKSVSSKMFVFFLTLFLSVNAFSGEPEGLHKKVNELLLANKTDEAEKLALEQYKLYPDKAEVICALACCYRHMATKSGFSYDNSAMGLKDGETGTYELQQGDIKKIFKDELFIDREKYKKAEKLYYEIIQKVPSYENSYFNLLNDYQTLNEFDSYFKVIKLYVQNLKGSVETPECMLDLAGKLYKKQQYSEAEKLYNIIIENYPGYMPAKSDLGVVYIVTGKLKKAIPLLKDVYEKTSDDMINMQSFFSALLYAEDFKSALEVSKRIYEKEKNNRQFLFNTCLLAFLLNADSKNYLQQFISTEEPLDGNKKDFYIICAEELANFKNIDEQKRVDFLSWALYQLYTQKYYEQAIIFGNLLHTIRETNQSLNIMAAIFDINSIGEKTIYYLDKINEKRKTDSSIMTEYSLNFNYGRSYYLLGDYKRSKEYLLKDFDVKKDDCKLNYVLGKCYLDDVNIEKAREFFKINADMNDKNQMEFINYSIRELYKLRTPEKNIEKKAL